MRFFLKTLMIMSFSFAFNIVSSEAFKLSDIKDNSTKIIFDIPEISISKDDNGFSKFDTNDMISKTIDDSFSEFPVFSSMFQMTPGIEYEIDYEVLSSHIIENIDFKSIDLSDGTVYPIENISLSSPLIMRDIVLGQVSFTPYKYYYEDKKLEVYDAVEIIITESNQIQSNYFLPEKKSYIFEELYENFIINYTKSDRDEDYQTPSILYICGGNSINNAYFQELVNWRHKQGYIVMTVSTSETGSSENNINDYISNAYLNWENPPEIVGLIGDVGGS
ncbi:hypothetical protein DBW61_00355, partial [bacterium]